MKPITKEELPEMEKAVKTVVKLLYDCINIMEDEGVNTNDGVLFNSFVTMLGSIISTTHKTQEEIDLTLNEVTKALKHGIARQKLYLDNTRGNDSAKLPN